VATESAQPPVESLYPAIEGFIETATVDEVGAVYDSLEEGLSQVKGPRAELAKKASQAIERTQELLLFLLEVRQKLEASRK
jgi:hypothetical protein